MYMYVTSHGMRVWYRVPHVGDEGTSVRGYATTQQGRGRGKVQTEDAPLTVVVFAAQHSEIS